MLVLTLHNETDGILAEQEFILHTGVLLATQTDRIFFPEAAPHGSVECRVSVLALEGGSETLRLCASDGTEYSFEVFVSGEGWYGGDAHTHSSYVDGSGTVEENVRASRALGLDWLYSTDHNVMPDDHPHESITAGYDGRFVNLMGMEVTTWRHTVAGKDSGHVVAYRIHSLPGDYLIPHSPRPEPADRNWSETTAEIVRQGGFCYVAHPYLKEYGMTDGEKYNIEHITGVEVINDTYSVYYTAPAFDFWDGLNAKGERLYYGISSSDAHAAQTVGRVYNKGHMPLLSAEGVNTALETGFFYGTNGPDLRFELGGAEMGEVLCVDGTQRVRAHLAAYDERGQLEKMVLYRINVTGSLMGSFTRVPVWEESFPQGTQSRDVYIELDVCQGELYRLEVTARKALNPTLAGREKGFAFSNPVLVKGGGNGARAIHSLTYDGGEIKANALGRLYLVTNGELRTEALHVTADGTAHICEHDGGIRITVTAHDGTQRHVFLPVMKI